MVTPHQRANNRPLSESINRALAEPVAYKYMTRCPFSLSRLVKVTKTGQVVYMAEKDACRAFPDPQGSDLAPGPKGNFQILDPLDFLAEFRAPSRSDGRHIPPKGSHLIRGAPTEGWSRLVLE
jgi:hypothetical protein